MKIRGYEERDFPALVALGGEMWAESDFRSVPFHVDALRRLSDMVLAGTCFFCMVAEERERIIGFFVGGVQPYFFSNALYGFDLAFYVSKDCRGSTAALRLLRAAEYVCTDMGALECRFGAATGINPEQTDSFLTKQDYRRGGVLYVKSN